MAETYFNVAQEGFIVPLKTLNESEIGIYSSVLHSVWLRMTLPPLLPDLLWL